MVFAFGDYRLDRDRRELRRGADVIELEPQVFDLLAYLVQERHRVVGKDELLQAVWGGRIVSDSALTIRVHAARRALGDDGTAQRWIRTFTRKGVRFVGEVRELAGPPARDALRAGFDAPSIGFPSFADLSGRPGLERFARGLAEETALALCRIRWLQVVSPRRAPQARYRLRGSIREHGGRVRILAPGVFEMFSARIADRMGFKALYMTGYGISGSHLGVADAGLVTYRDMVERARTIAQGTATPLIADADTGFGGLLNVRETVRGYEAAGVQAIQIEDQEMPKKCGHTPNRRVVPLEDAVKRVEVAVEARRSSDFLIVARTDARAGLGLDEAIRRSRAFAKAGADILFVEAPESEAELERIGAELAGEAKLLANMVPTGRSPMLPAETLKRCGYSIAIYPSAGMGAACAALEGAYGWLLKNGSLEDSPVPAFDMARLHELVGFAEVWDFERRHVEK